ncbi:MAG TPA: hypothetical protein VF527_00295 [Pyrinomonadaceae bacterium]|jgi:hypothetical protein
MFRRSKVGGGFALILALLSLAGAAGAQTVAPGKSVGRDVGALAITCAVDDKLARVLVTLKLEGQLVGQSALTHDSRKYRFNVKANGNTARGELRLQLNAVPQLSSVEAVILTRKGTSPLVPFRGSLATWLAPDELIYVERSFFLSPVLRAQTTVRGLSKSNVTVDLYAGSMLLYSVSMNQVSPVAQIPDELVLGDVRLAAGAKFILTIPTEQQVGQVLMQAQFQSRNTPPTNISADIALWPW